MAKTYLKRALKVVVFLLIFVAGMAGCMYLLDYHGDGNEMLYRSYAKEEKDTIDGIFVGNSSINRSWVAPIAWDECGFTTYSLSSGNQPICLATSIIEQARTEQDLKFAVVDIHPLRRTTYYSAYAPSIKRVADNMPRFSKIRWNAVTKGINYYKASYHEQGMDDVIEEYMAGKEVGFYLKFLQYHPRWSELDIEDFRKPLNQYKSAYTEPIFYTQIQEEPDPKDPKEEQMEKLGSGLTDAQKATLQELIDYAEENEFHIFFISVPTFMNEEDSLELKEAFDILADVDSEYVDYLDFNTDEMIAKLGINKETDFYDGDHLNYLGAPKLTSYLAKEIKKRYGLEDKRGDSKYASWDKAVEDYAAKKEEMLEMVEDGQIYVDKKGHVTIFDEHGKFVTQE